MTNAEEPVTAATPGQADVIGGSPSPELRAAILGIVQELVACGSDLDDKCPRCKQHTDEILAAVAAQQPHAVPDLAEAIDPAKLDLLADWFDVDDLAKGRSGRTEVQADLRRWAKLVRDARESAAPAPELAAMAQENIRLAATSRMLREQLAKVRAIVFRSDTQQSRIRDLVELLDPAADAPPAQPAPELAAAMREARGYRDALERAQRHLSDTALGAQRRVRLALSAVTAGLVGK